MSGTNLSTGRNFEFRGRGQGRGRGRGSSPDLRGRGSDGRATHTSWRGRGAPTDRPGQRGDFKSKIGRQEVEPLEAQAKGDLLSTIELDAIKFNSYAGKRVWSLHGCEDVASYNLLHHRHTTILVPGNIAQDCAFVSVIADRHQGAPRAWIPPKECPELRQDKGFFFRDMIEAKWPDFPSEPGLRAVFDFRPDFDTSKLNVVTCATVLENLLRFLSSTERSFRFNVEYIGGTVFFVSKGTSPREGLTDVRGYGHTYPDAYTTWGPNLENSLCHQRLIRYQFGDLNCLLQFKADGYLEEKLSNGSTAKEAVPQHPLGEEETSLATQVAAISLSAIAPSNQPKLKVQTRGMGVPQSSVFELKTRSTQYETALDPILLRLWLTQVPNLILARHTYGKFEDTAPQDMTNNVRDWERRNQRLLRWLHALLLQIIDAAKDSKDRKIEVRRIGEGPLEIRRVVQSSWSALPEDLKAQWRAASGHDSDEEGGDDYLNF